MLQVLSVFPSELKKATHSLPPFPLQPTFSCCPIKTEALLLRQRDINTAAGSGVSMASLEKGIDFKAVNI